MKEFIVFGDFLLGGHGHRGFKNMPKTSSGGQILGFKMSKSRGREEKLRQKKAERRKKKKLGNMKENTFLVGAFLGQS